MVLSTLSVSNESGNLMTNIWFKLNQRAKIPQVTDNEKNLYMILALKFKVRKMFTNHSVRKTTDSKHCTLTYHQSHGPSSHITKVTGLRTKDFLNDYARSRRKIATTTLFCKKISKRNYKKPSLGKSKYWQFPTSQQLWLHSPMDGNVKRKQIASFFFEF